MTAGPGAGRTPTLDGLRGIAVLAVVIEHAWPTVLPGGFAGVDVFFVLSGYLITRMLLGELGRTGRIDLTAFYARRVRRIIPAAALCAVVVAIVFTAILGVGFGPDFRLEALSAVLAVSNLLFVSRATDYFAADPSSSPFLHYWSLAVEEQFYLFWPALLIILFAIGRFAANRAGRRPPESSSNGLGRLPLAIAAGIALVSFALTVAGPETRAFFLLPHRSWELLAGALLAWFGPMATWRPAVGLAPLRWGLAVGGFAALAVTFVSSLTGWPGVMTLLPVLGTVALIAGGTELPGARLLSMGWLRFFGRISYALYLWHWPALAAVALVALPAPEPPLWMTLGAVLGATLLATGSTFLVEEPIRFSRRRWFARTGALVGAAGVLALSVGTVVLATSSTTPSVAENPEVVASPGGGGPSTPSAEPLDIRSQLATVRDDRERLISDNCYTRVGQTDVHSCVYGAASAPDGSPVDVVPAGMPVAILFGDSHAMSWFPAVNTWATESGYALVALTRSGCPAIDADVASEPDNVIGCNTWRGPALTRLSELDPAITIVASSSGGGVMIDGAAVSPRKQPGPWIAPTARFLRAMPTGGSPIVYIADTPRPGFSVPDCFAAHSSDPGACALPVDEAQPADFIAAEREMAAAAGVAFVDPTDWICPSGICTWIMDGRIAYLDEHHITASASLAMASRLGAILSAAAAGKAPA